MQVARVHDKDASVKGAGKPLGGHWPRNFTQRATFGGAIELSGYCQNQNLRKVALESLLPAGEIENRR
jgi:hypothetical protein